MGTRGAIGFIIDGEQKVTYNHFDSYPEGVGTNVLNFARSVTDWEAIKTAARKIKLVDESRVPSAREAARLAEFADGSVSTGKDWYSLLRGAQGDLAAYLKAGAMPDSNTFPLDSLFCEYAYVIDLDEVQFEAYVGFQKVEHTDGRFAGPANDGGYYPVRLVATWPLDSLPTEVQFLAEFARMDDGEGNEVPWETHTYMGTMS